MWFRFCSLIFAMWGLVFFFFPHFTNEFAGIGYVASEHAEDWTQIVGVFSLAFAVVLNEAHHTNVGARRIVARGVLAFTLPCALLMTYWQIIPDRRWVRLDIANILLLYLMSIGFFLRSDVWKPQRPTSSRR